MKTKWTSFATGWPDSDRHEFVWVANTASDHIHPCSMDELYRTDFGSSAEFYFWAPLKAPAMPGDPPCPSAIACGPGHQSIFYCEEEGKHVVHRADDGELRWEDDDHRQTYTPRAGARAGVEHQLAFSDRGWC